MTIDAWINSAAILLGFIFWIGFYYGLMKTKLKDFELKITSLDEKLEQKTSEVEEKLDMRVSNLQEKYVPFRHFNDIIKPLQHSISELQADIKKLLIVLRENRKSDEEDFSNRRR